MWSYVSVRNGTGHSGCLRTVTAGDLEEREGKETAQVSSHSGKGGAPET